MKQLREFDIAFVGLKPGVSIFEYQITDSFFEEYGPQDFSNCNASVRLTLDKKSDFFLLKFEIGGSMTVICDRCGQPFDLQLWDDFTQVVKMVENPEAMEGGDEDPEVSYISRTESHLNVREWIYEFINLSIPMQKVHPDVDGKSTCDPKILEMLDQMNKQSGGPDNPIWKDLDKFRNN